MTVRSTDSWWGRSRYLMNILLDVDSFVLAVSLAGIALAIAYVYREFSRCSSSTDDIDEDLDKELRRRFSEILISESDRKNLTSALFSDYSASGSEISRRNNITLIVGTIMLTSSFLILANVAVAPDTRPMPVFSLASIGLYIVWLFVLHDTGKRLDEITYKRIHTIEQALSKDYPFGIHTYLQGKLRYKGKIPRWLRLRRSFWAIVLLLLSLAWLALSVKQFFVTF